jgi:hypothetical protein
MRFMATEKNGTIPVFIEFLKRLLFKQKEPVYLIREEDTHRTGTIFKGGERNALCINA